MRLTRFSSFAMLVLASAGVNGCAILGDVFNSDFLSGIGLDPDVFSGPPGKTVLALRNESDFPAQFNIVDFRNGEGDTVPPTVVDAGATASVVLDCPISFLSLGQLTDMGVDNMMGIEVFAAATVPVPYAAGVLQSGVQFRCGDVIEILLSQPGAAGMAATDFAVTTRVIPGR